MGRGHVQLDELLALDPADEDARRCRAVALAKKNRCQEALEACGDDEALADIRAYCQRGPAPEESSRSAKDGFLDARRETTQ